MQSMGKSSAADQGSAGSRRQRTQLTEGQEELLVAVAKQSMSSAARVRLLQAAALQTLICLKSAKVIDRMLAAGRSYHEKTKGVKNHGAGAPDVWLWAAAVEQALADPAVVEDKRELLQTHYNNQKDPNMLAGVIKVFRVSRAFDKTKKKVEISVCSSIQEEKNIVIQSMVNQGAELLTGIAPRGPQERTIARVLQSMGELQGNDDKYD